MRASSIADASPRRFGFQLVHLRASAFQKPRNCKANPIFLGCSKPFKGIQSVSKLFKGFGEKNFPIRSTIV
jgi:hypothetical protein